MKKILLLFICAVSFLFADATITISKTSKKMPVVQIQDSTDSSFTDSSIKNKFFSILLADLKVTTYFETIETHTQVAFDHPYKSDHINNPEADLILRYQLSYESDSSGPIIATVKIINPKKNSLIGSKGYKIAIKSRYPLLAHSITMDLADSIGAGNIDWMDKYIIFARYVSPKESEIVLADYSLTFQQVLVRGGLNIFPKWADKNQDSFFYTSYNLAKPTVYRVNLTTGVREKIIDSSGMAIVSDVSSDGNKILVTMAPDDQSDVYMYNLLTKELINVTKYGGVDTSGSFVDDESGIVFVSERLGYPNIFYKKIKGSSVEQMVHHGRNNAAASAHKNYIVYTSRDKSSEFGPQTFNLFLISTKTDYIRQLTATGKNLFPRFSDDGESIVFIKEFEKESGLGIIRLGANKSFHFPLNKGKIQSIDW
ncbi:MAG: Tol-Pal system protein TolB [Campylobacteraceae bacterium]|jgi:TolB protein|nr:Tol-Pal system protein TolB [Campylobacteraceae bacterium]